MYLFFGMAGLLAYAVWQRQELEKFRVTQYEMESCKVNKKIKLVVISDLHLFSYGTGNQRLVRAVRDAAPDLILIPGDLIITAKAGQYGVAAHLIEQIVTVAPVVFCNGNHESKALAMRPAYKKGCQALFRRMERAGVLILNNQSKTMIVNGNTIQVNGLELPLSSYKKGRKPYLEKTFIQKQLGKPDKDRLQILLSHNPAFARQYALWGADLTVCGHNHGGLVRLPGIGSLISPQLMLFPKYDAGEFTVHGKKIYVSRGLGTHTFHIRIHNRAELVVVTVNPKRRCADDYVAQRNHLQ